MRFSIFAGLAATLACALGFPGAAHAAKLLKTTTGAAVHWEDATITLGLDGEAKSQGLDNRSVLGSLAEAAKAWNAVAEMKVHFAAPSAEAASPATAVTVRFCKGSWRYRAGLLANTEFTAAIGTGVVTRATILVNECDYKFVGPEEVADGHFDLQAVLTHELGHVLGLAHSDDLSAVMFENTGGVRQRRPTPDDRVGIASIYDPGFKPTVASAAPLAPAKPARPGADPVVGDLPVGQELPWPDAAPGAKATSTRPVKTPGKPTAPGVPAVPTAPKVARALPPAGVINAVRLDGKDKNGQTLMLYTIEPILLPAFETAPEKPIAKPAPRAKTPHGRAPR